MEDPILYLSRAQVEKLCSDIDATGVIRELFRFHGSGKTILPEEAYLGWQNSEGDAVRSLNMPGYVSAPFNAAGTKIINGNPGNIRRGLPRATGVTLLYDVETTRIQCIMESAFVSSLRTASVTMLCAELFQQYDVASVCIIGAGAISAAHVRVFPKHLKKLERIRIYDHDPEAAKRLAAEARALYPSGNVTVEVSDSAEHAVRDADMVVPATTTTVGYIPFAWLKRGALVVHISLDDLMADVVHGADLVLVDDWPLVKVDPRRLLGRMYRSGDLVGPDEEPKAGARKIDGSIADVVTGRHPGRTSREQIVMVNPFGLAIEDVALASRVYALARERGIGMELPR
jgi:ornithine cyclodeaminase/alanine dehydrogenase-like protein (mu-crystallin family)